MSENQVLHKNRLIEELLRLTAQMQMRLLKNDFDAFDRELEERSRLFAELARLDQSQIGQPTPRDDIWLNQLKSINQSDQEIMKILQQHRDAVLREDSNEQKLKGLLLATSIQESKGKSIQVQG